MTTTTTAPISLQGYVIQTWKEGAQYFEHEDIKAYAVKGQLPSKWEEVKADTSIVEARIYKTTQSAKRADKRLNSDYFKR